MIELLRLRKVFGGRTAVDHLDLQVARGQVFGLLGHNGAGKSTTIGMMLGQIWPSGGQARISGFNVATHRRRALKRVGAIFETPAFYEFLSGWSNLRILSECTGRTEPRRIQEVIDWVGLSGHERRKVKTYSHGMRARLAVAQALLPNPELLILDEPADGLDPEGIHEIRQMIRRLNQEFGLTILFSSHLLSEVEQLCSRIAVLNHGKLIFHGAMQDAIASRRQVRLLVNDYDKAVACLNSCHLIEGFENDGVIYPADSVSNETIVDQLVQQGFKIREIVTREQTLEDFYLKLVRREDG